MSAPLAYHITFGTYGTRLHGDERGTVDRRHNTPGDPVLGPIKFWQNKEQQLLKNPPIVLTHEQCTFAETSLPDICRRGDWTYHIAAAQEDHVHVLLTSDRESKAVRRWLKSWLSEALSKEPRRNNLNALADVCRHRGYGRCNGCGMDRREV